VVNGVGGVGGLGGITGVAASPDQLYVFGLGGAANAIAVFRGTRRPAC